MFHKYPAIVDIVVTNRKGEPGQCRLHRVTFFFDNIKLINTGEAHNVCGDLTCHKISNAAGDFLNVQKFIIVSAEISSRVSHVAREGSPEGIVFCAEEKQDRVDVLIVKVVNPIFNGSPCGLNAGGG